MTFRFIFSSLPLIAQVNGKNQMLESGKPAYVPGQRSNLPLDRVLGLVTDAFTGATEREIYVGDMMELYVVQTVRDAEGKVTEIKMGTLRKALKQD